MYKKDWLDFTLLFSFHFFVVHGFIAFQDIQIQYIRFRDR